ncbi:hypothetical protein [Alicyclobacillus sp. ALC3]|uniref:hypothetical protein n=1 Tax=Alicyclobacillus sp. ALC3 TaxID=2796143 RepID=UPI0023789DFA|nr:hypothetical protein [Alicyclobacillus sp. ALC3]WDL98837.1 hypothetical protein JC200_09385 [Alicyclobacillus sp. ALC3]
MTTDSIKVVRESLEEYLYEYLDHYDEDAPDIVIKHIDDDKVIVFDVTIEKSVCIKWINLLKTPLQEWYERNKGTIDIHMWNEIFRGSYDYTLDNERLVYQPGLFVHKGYAEVHIEYASLHFNSEVDCFKIGDVSCDVGFPSSMYTLLHKHMEDGDTFTADDWSSIFTLRLENITRENYKAYLEQALFILYYSNPPQFDGDYPHVAFSGKTDSPISQRSTDFLHTDFPTANYVEPLNFFNTGGSTGEVLYFYKVIEYFFLINRKQEITSIIQSDQNIDRKISDLTKVYKEDEENLLISIMHTLKSHHRFDSVLHYAVNRNLVNSNDTNEFANKMYLYRNSIVHGKKDNRFDILTRDLVDQEPDGWFIVIREVALICIEVFCYQDNLKEMVQSVDEV